jgi:hypothetical protein
MYLVLPLRVDFSNVELRHSSHNEGCVSLISYLVTSATAASFSFSSRFLDTFDTSFPLFPSDFPAVFLSHRGTDGEWIGFSQ